MKIRDSPQYHHDLVVLAGLHEHVGRDLQHFVHEAADHRTAHAVQATMLHKLRESVDLGYLGPEFAAAVEAVVEMDGPDVKVAYRFRHEYDDARQCNAELRGVMENMMNREQSTGNIIHVSYCAGTPDGCCDVLYISIGSPRPGYCDECLPGVLLRSIKPDGEVTGVTIVDFLRWFVPQGKINDLPATVPQVIMAFLRALALDPQRCLQYIEGGEVLA
jgi:hypothetical protein